MDSHVYKSTLEERLTEVEKEIELRKKVYPRWYAAGKLTKEKGARKIQVMEDVAADLKRRIKEQAFSQKKLF